VAEESPTSTGGEPRGTTGGPEQERMEENQTEKGMGNETCSEGTKVMVALKESNEC
jgi:hypothetical protein